MKIHTFIKFLLLISALQLNLSSASDIPVNTQKDQRNQDETVIVAIEKLNQLSLFYKTQLAANSARMKNRTDLLDLYIRTIAPYKKIIEHYDALESKTQGETFKILSQYRENVLLGLYQIMQTVVISTQCTIEFHNEYQAVFKRLSPDLQDTLKESEETLRLMVDFDRVRNNSSHQGTVKSKKLETIAQQFIRKLEDQPYVDTSALHAKLLMISMIDKETTWRTIVIDTLEKIESAIRQLSPDQERTPLSEIYLAYRKIMRNIGFKPTLIKILSAYVGEGRIPEALERAEILAEYERKNNNGIVSDETRLLIANLKNLLGDHTELLILEQDRAKPEQNKKQKAMGSKALVEINRQRQIQADRENAEKTKAEEQRKIELIKQQLRAKNLQEQESTPVLFHDDKPSNRKKRKTHQAIQPLEPQASSSNAKDPEPKTVYEQRCTQIEEANADSRTLADLYPFTHQNKAVNTAIENNTWQFTRSELSQYFQSMGCEIKSGKGSHEKVSLPTSLQVIKDGKLITILSDIGGALTLPKWDKTVPHYLRPQILEARNLIKWMTIYSKISLTQQELK